MADIQKLNVNNTTYDISTTWEKVTGKPSTFTPSSHTHTASEVSGLPTKLSAFTNDVGFVTVRQKNGFSYNNLATLYTSHASIYRIDLTDVQVNIWTMLFIEVSLRQNYSPGYGGKILINLYHNNTSDFTQFNATILGNLNNIYVYSSDRRYIYISASMSYSTISVDRVLVGDNAVTADLSNITIEKVDSLPDTYQTATIYYGLHTGNFTKSIVEGVLTGDITSHTHSFASLTSKPTTIEGFGITDVYTASTIDSKLSGYLPLSGGTLNHNKGIGFRAYSAYDGGGGWAVNVINLYDRDVTKIFGRLGYFGNNLNLDYIYLGTETHNGVNLKIYGTGTNDIKWGNNSILHAGNYNSYAPTLTGTGASGTWGINITGNAATATNATNADKLDGYHHDSFAKIGSVNNLLHAGNEFTYVGPAYKGDIWHNYRTSSGGADGNIKNYYFGNGHGGHDGVTLLADNFTGNAGSATKLQTPRTLWGQSFDGSGDVSGSLYGANSILSNTTNGYYVGNRNDGLGATTGGLLLYSYGNTPMSFYTNGNERMHITGDGKVGIGTTSPTHKLDINGSANATTLYENGTRVALSGHTHSYLPLSGGTLTGLLTTTSGNSHNGIKIGSNYINAIDGDLIFQNNNSIRFGGDSWDYNVWAGLKYVHSSKSIYLGLADGTQFTANTGQSGGKVYFPGISGLYAAAYYQSSDERLKTFYDPIKVDLDKLSKLRKNYFKFNDKDKLEIGVSAQEVQSIYPEIVSTDDNGYLSVAYDKLSVIALAAIDELDNKYKKEINDLKDQLDAIKNILNEKGIL